MRQLRKSMYRRSSFASSSTASITGSNPFITPTSTLLTDPFASSATLQLVPTSPIDATPRLGLNHRNASNATLASDFEDQMPESSITDVGIARFKPPTNVDRLLLPLRAMGNLAVGRPKKGTQRNEKTRKLLGDTLKMQSFHADDIPTPSLLALKNTQAE